MVTNPHFPSIEEIKKGVEQFRYQRQQEKRHQKWDASPTFCKYYRSGSSRASTLQTLLTYWKR